MTWLPAAVNGNGPVADAWYPMDTPPPDAWELDMKGVSGGDAYGPSYGPYNYQPRYGSVPYPAWNNSDIVTTPAERPKWPGPYLKEPDWHDAPPGAIGWQLKDMTGEVSPDNYISSLCEPLGLEGFWNDWYTNGGHRDYFHWWSQRWITGYTAVETRVTVQGTPVNPVQNNYVDFGTVPKLVRVLGEPSVPGAIVHVMPGTTSDYITPATVLTNLFANQINGGGTLVGPFSDGQTTMWRMTTLGYVESVMVIDVPPFAFPVIVPAARIRNRPDTTGGNCSCPVRLEMTFEAPLANEFRWLPLAPLVTIPPAPPAKGSAPTRGTGLGDPRGRQVYFPKG
jgi:hypothetical protein